jgi:hypothetical protein
VAFAPAVRGYPGGIADMASDLDEPGADEPVGDGELWAITVGAERGDAPGRAEDAPGWTEDGPGRVGDAPDPVQQAGPIPGQPAQPGSRQAQPVPVEQVSVWQQSAAAWQEARIDWLRSASAGAGQAGSAPAASTLARPASSLPAEDGPHTEPLPVISGDAALMPGARSGQESPAAAAAPPGRKQARVSRAGVRTDETAASTDGAPGTADAPEGTPGTAPAGPARNGHTAGQPGADEGAAGSIPAAATTSVASAPAGRVGDGAAASHAGDAAAAGHAGDGAAASHVGDGAAASRAGDAAKAHPATADAAPAGPAAADGASPGEAAAGADDATAGMKAVRGTGSGPPGTAAAPGRALRGRRLAVAATAAVVLLAGTIAAIGIARSGNSGPAGPARPEFALVTPYSPVSPADADFASQAAGATPLLPSLAGIAAAGQTVIAVGAQPSQPGPAPLMLLSTDGGRTWTRATVTAPSAAGPGALAPGSSGLTAGPGPTTGPGPAAGPESAGLALAPAMVARSGSTWLALGQDAAWTSPDGKVWQPAPVTPEAAGDKVLGLAATSTGFVAVGEHIGSQPGPVVWTTTDGQVWRRESGHAHGLTARGGHVAVLRWAAADGGVIVVGGPITAAARHRPATGLWRSTNGGRTWDQVKLPTTHGATSRLAGLATNGRTFLAVRPARAGAGRKDAVAYLSAHGSRWSYAGKLAPVRRISMRVTAVAGSGHGFAVAGVTRSGQLAFLSKHGHGWRRSGDPGSGVAGLTAGPDGNVVVAGNSQGSAGAAGIQPHLLLVRASGRKQVGQSVLTAAATPDITINALAAAGQAQVAAGAAGGGPALWLASPSGQWAPVGLQLPASWRSGALLSVAHSRSGWLTVGQAGTQAPYQPVIMMSASGTSWTTAPGAGPLTAPGSSLAAVAAGPAGYVVVGSATADGRPVPAAWFSADLSTWALAPLSGPADGGQMLAVTAARSGFVAAGAVGGSPVVWTSTGGSDWRRDTLPRPAGAASAALTTVTAIGDKVVAIGSEYRGAAVGVPVPFAAVSADGGRTWRESALPAPPSPAVVTALTTAGRGFVAVGHPGLPGQPGLLTWWSANGATWHFAGPAGGGAPGQFVTQLNAVIAGNGTLTGAGFAASRSAEHPVLWHARYR